MGFQSKISRARVFLGLLACGVFIGILIGAFIGFWSGFLIGLGLWRGLLLGLFIDLGFLDPPRAKRG
jgi:hypothetical protein